MYGYTLAWQPDPLGPGDEEPAEVSLEADGVAPGEFWSWWDEALGSVAIEPAEHVPSYHLSREAFLATVDHLVEGGEFRVLPEHLRGEEAHAFYGVSAYGRWEMG